MSLAGLGPPAQPVGHSLWVRYRGFPLHHQRLVVAVSSDGDRMFVVSPDFDSYMEDYSRANPDIDSVRWSNADGSPPEGVPRAQAYRFRTWPDADAMSRFMLAADRAMPPSRRGIFGAVAAALGSVVGNPAAPLPGPIVEEQLRRVG